MDNYYPVGIVYREAKGLGRGWWGPPKGTHGAEGQEGAELIDGDIPSWLAAKKPKITETKGIADPSDWGWEEERSEYARLSYEATEAGTAGITFKDRGVPIGICTYRETPTAIDIGMLATAVSDRGYGTEIMRRMCVLASQRGREVTLWSSPSALKFYQRLGMDQSGWTFSFGKAATKRFAEKSWGISESDKWKLSDEVPEEPVDGIFTRLKGK